MKRKLSLLMAAVMTLSALPFTAVDVQANNSVSSITGMPNIVQNNTFFVEMPDLNEGLFGLPGNRANAPAGQPSQHVPFAAGAGYLEIAVNSPLSTGQTFNVELVNAEWFFRAGSQMYVTPGASGIGIGTPVPYVAGLATALGATAVQLSATDASVNSGGWWQPNDEDDAPPAASGQTMTQLLDILLTDTTTAGGPGQLIRNFITGTGTFANTTQLGASVITDLQTSILRGRSGLELAANAADTGYHRIFGRNNAAGMGADNPGIPMTYDIRRGVFVPNTNLAGSQGTYVRFGQHAEFPNASATQHGQPLKAREVAYAMEVSRTNTSLGTVRILENMASPAANQPWIIRIPLAMRVLSLDDIAIHVNQAGTGPITPQTIRIIGAAGAATAAHVVEPVVARDRFPLEQLIIRELGINSIRRTGPGENGFAGANAFDIVLPPGFYFDNNLNQVRLFLEQGLTWQGATNLAQTEGAAATSPTGPRAGWAMGGDLNTGTNSGHRFVNAAGTAVIGEGDFNIFFPQGYAINRNRLRVRLNNFNETTGAGAVPGAIGIEGLVVWAEENAPFNIDVELTLENTQWIEDGQPWSAGGAIQQRNTRNLVTAQTIRAASRRDWEVTLSAVTPVPELISGRYMSSPSVPHVFHQTSRITFEEIVPNSWWAGRTVVLTLPEEVRWRRVFFQNVRGSWGAADLEDQIHVNIDPVQGQNLWGPQMFASAGRQAGRNVRFDANRMYWADVLAQRPAHLSGGVNDRARIVFDAWVSIAAHFEGPIYLTATGTAVPYQVYETLPSVVIATAVPPVRIDTVVTDTRIGYQWQQTADIIITETRAGNLLHQDGFNNVRLTVTDYVTIDTLFSPDVEIAVTGGNLVINNISGGLAGNLFWAQAPTLGINQTGGTLSFDIRSQSHGEPAEITVSNVSVRVDRTVPETNDRPFQVVVWGTAIARNFGDFGTWIPNWGPEHERTNNDRFMNYPGIATDYIRVVTGGDGSGWLSQEIRIAIGETYYTVNGVPMGPIDAPAMLVGDNTFVPIRFISNAFGLHDDRDIRWDDASSAVTLTLPTGRVVQFQVGSTIMLDNGIPVNIADLNGQPIAPEMLPVGTDGGARMMLPFRFVGQEVFGVEVAWEDETRTAIFNPSRHTGN